MVKFLKNKRFKMTKKIKLLLEKNKYIKQVVLFIYVNTYGKYKNWKKTKNFLSHADEILEKVDQVFKELNIEYWLDFGTLLGAIRDNDFIKHDNDLDFAVFLKDYTPKMDDIFTKYGFKKIKTFIIDEGIYGREETYVYSGVEVDIFFYTRINKQEAYYHDFVPLPGKSRDKTILEIGGLVPREITLSLEGVEYIDFKGKKYPVPSPVEKHLADRYGKDFMIENRSWSLGKEKNKNIKILTNKIGIRKIYE